MSTRYPHVQKVHKGICSISWTENKMAQGKVLVALVTVQTVLSIFNGYLIFNRGAVPAGGKCCRRASPVQHVTVTDALDMVKPKEAIKDTGSTDVTAASLVPKRPAGIPGGLLSQIGAGKSLKKADKTQRPAKRKGTMDDVLGQMNSRIKINFIKGYKFPSTAESPTYKYMALYKFKGKYYFKLETKNKEGDVSASNDLEFLEPETKLIKETIGDPETFVQEYENAHVFNTVVEDKDYAISFISPTMDKNEPADQDTSYPKVKELLNLLLSGIKANFNPMEFKFEKLKEKVEGIEEEYLKIAIEDKSLKKSYTKGSAVSTGKAGRPGLTFKKKNIELLKGIKLPSPEGSPTFKFFALYKFEDTFYYELGTGYKVDNMNANEYEVLSPDTGFIKLSIEDPIQFRREFPQGATYFEKITEGNNYDIGFISPSLNKFLKSVEKNVSYPDVVSIFDLILKGINGNFSNALYEELKSKSITIDEEFLRVIVRDKGKASSNASLKEKAKIEFVKGFKFPSAADSPTFRYLALYKQNDKYFYELANKKKTSNKSTDDVSSNQTGNELEEINPETDFIQSALKDKFFLTKFSSTHRSFTTTLGNSKYLISYSSPLENKPKVKPDEKDEGPYYDTVALIPLISKGIKDNFNPESFNFEELRQKSSEVAGDYLRIKIEVQGGIKDKTEVSKVESANESVTPAEVVAENAVEGNVAAVSVIDPTEAAVNVLDAIEETASVANVKATETKEDAAIVLEPVEAAQTVTEVTELAENELSASLIDVNVTDTKEVTLNVPDTKDEDKVDPDPNEMTKKVIDPKNETKKRSKKKPKVHKGNTPSESNLP